MSAVFCPFAALDGWLTAPVSVKGWVLLWERYDQTVSKQSDKSLLTNTGDAAGHGVWACISVCVIKAEGVSSDAQLLQR